MAKKFAPKPNTVTVFLDEHISLPGCPQIIVTRIWAYNWLRDTLGYDPKERGFGSIDYMAFGRREVAEPLTDLSQPWVVQTLAFIESVEKA